MITIQRTYVMWVLFFLVSLGSIIFSIKYFDKAVPLVNLDLRMNRHEALAKATTIARELTLGPTDYRQVASFRTDQTTKIYVELEAGGAHAFNKMVTGNVYSPYTWQVRHFKPHQIHELNIIFKPDGTPYGFSEQISEETPGFALSSEQAEKIAQKEAQNHWHINFNEYNRVEVSKDTKPNGRVDHTFVYERPETIGQAHYRLVIVVSGDKVTQLFHFVKVPEQFIHRFKQMRSSNETLKQIADVLRFVLYFLGIGIFGLIVLLRRRYLVWKAPLIAGLVISSLDVLETFSGYPLEYWSYETTTPIHTFIVDFVIKAASNFIYLFLFSTLIFMLAESLSRLAFKNHPKLWNLWSKSSGSSWQILGQTTAGYLLVPLLLADVTLFYMFATRYLGWWVPSEQNMDPNILATYVPWINAISTPVRAGFIEECLFRAFPLAAAALLGQRFGKKNWWMAAAFIIQIFIFGASHADYPGFPAYSRLVELILSSACFGYVYLKFGLLIGIICHGIYDLVWCSLPLFVSTAHHAWMNQLPIILLGLFPIFILLIRRWQYGSWHNLDATGYNHSWIPTPIEQKVKRESAHIEASLLKKSHIITISILGLLGSICWISFNTFKTDAPSLLISRNQAINIAHERISHGGYQVKDWYPLTRVDGFNIPALGSTGLGSPDIVDQHRFIWQKGGKQLYHTLLNSYLDPAHWIVRFIRFSGSLEDRAEEFVVVIAPNGQVLRLAHKIPESRAGKHLSEEEARILAHKAIKELYDIDPAILKEISAQSSKQPNRLDWIFTFSDTQAYHLQEGQARIMIGIEGDELADYLQYIYVPQEWSRKQETDRSIFDVINLIASKLITFIWLLACILLVVSGISISRKSMISILSLVCLLFVIRIANNLPLTFFYYLNAQEPYLHQIFRLGSSIFMALISTIITTGIGLIIASKKLRTPNRLSIAIAFALGCAWVGLIALIKYIAPSLQPLWGNYNNLGSYSPLLTVVIRTLFDFITQTTFLIFVVKMVNMIKNIPYGNVVKSMVLICTACVIMSSLQILTINHLIISCILTSIFFMMSYFVAFNKFPESLIWFVATIIGIQSIQQAIFNIVPHAWANTICTIGTLIIAAWIWGKFIAQENVEDKH